MARISWIVTTEIKLQILFAPSRGGSQYEKCIFEYEIPLTQMDLGYSVREYSLIWGIEQERIGKMMFPCK